MSSQHGELWTTNGWDWSASLGTPANFNGFLILASLLHWRRSTEVNQTSHDVWPTPGLVDILTFSGTYPNGICQMQNSLCIQVLRSPILAALLHSTRAICVSQTWWHDSAGRPPHGTSLPHLLVFVKFMLARISWEVVNSINTFRGNDILLVTRCNYV